VLCDSQTCSLVLWCHCTNSVILIKSTDIVCGRVCICLNVGSCGSRNVWHADPLGLASGPSAGGVVTSLYWCESQSWIFLLEWSLPPEPLLFFRYSRTCSSVRDLLKHRRCSDCWLEKWIKCWQLANSVLGFVKQWFLNLFFSSPSWCSEGHRPILGHTQEYSLCFKAFCTQQDGEDEKSNWQTWSCPDARHEIIPGVAVRL